MSDQSRMQELVKILNKAAESYYAKDEEIMSNYDYDRLYDELTALEEKTGIILSDSPTIRVGYESVDELPKEKHEKPMLSLNKTKSREELAEWLSDKRGLLSWKLDGLTIVLTYQDGILQKAVTRGNGEIGEVITNNARVFKNIPLQIAHKGELILRGEAVITYSDFEKINLLIDNPEDRYKNPRNLCSGSVRQLNNKITAERNVRFYAFSLVKAEGYEKEKSKENQYLFLRELGFDVVEFFSVTKDTILSQIADFAERIKTYDVPSDGLVLCYDDIEYSRSLGRTAKFPRDSIAFKWADELAETTLQEIEWSPSRTGLINPVAVFEPVSLEGTIVSRASVHNVSILKGLKLGIGDRITVYKANMIIPQIAENLTQSDNIVIPTKCPACGGETQVRSVNEAASLYCTNPDCDAKKIKAFTLFVSRDAMNIDGISESTLEKFLTKGFLHEYADLYHLDRHKEEIVQMEGFGEKSYQNMLQSIEISRETTLPRIIYAQGIANIGLANAKLLCRHFKGNPEEMIHAETEELASIEGIGEVIGGAFSSFMKEEKNLNRLLNLLKEVHIAAEESSTLSQTLTGMTVVITGSLFQFENRKELQEKIEERGGKATSSVTSKTSILINNDSMSSSTKNKTAKELGIPILTEEEFTAQYLS